MALERLECHSKLRRALPVRSHQGWPSGKRPACQEPPRPEASPIDLFTSSVDLRSSTFCLMLALSTLRCPRPFVHRPFSYRRFTTAPFVPSEPFRPSLMFADKSWSLPQSGAPMKSLNKQERVYVARLSRDEHCSVLWKFVNCGRKKLYNIDPWCQHYKLFLVCHFRKSSNKLEHLSLTTPSYQVQYLRVLLGTWKELDSVSL